MALTQEQIKGRIRNIAKDNKADARILIRIYMMERFLERVTHSHAVCWDISYQLPPVFLYSLMFTAFIYARCFSYFFIACSFEI